MAITPSSKQYTIKNIGFMPISWTVAASQTWVDISASSGVLNAGSSQVITVSFNAEAESLPASPDPYVAQVSFVNVTNGCGNIILLATVTITEDGPVD